MENVMRAVAFLVSLWGMQVFVLSAAVLAEDSEGAEQTGEMQADTSQLADSDLKVSAYAINGQKFGVAKIRIQGLEDLSRRWQLEQPIVIHSQECRTWLPAWVSRENNNLFDDASHEIYFVFDQGFPESVELKLPALKQKLNVPVTKAAAGAVYASEVNRWWQAFGAQSNELVPKDLRNINKDLLDSLGSLLSLHPRHSASQTSSSSQLEQEFERTLGMLLGFESVRLAMMTDESNSRLTSAEANMRLPASLNIAPVPIQAFPSSVKPPEISSMVPKDCYFVRCQTLDNYLWLRGLLLDWGGSLNELVSSSVVSTDVRARLERQLGLSAEALSAAGANDLIQDMAVIGSDLLFEQGAGVGILLKSSSAGGAKLTQIIEDMRSEVAARALHVESAGVRGSFLTTDDHQVRSYYFRLGDYHLITNSSHLLRSVIVAKQSKNSLADLSEFKYALATHPSAGDSKILFYLSDPFFRRLASAPFRIELGRRRAAEADCRRLHLATMMANATDYGTLDKRALIESSLLPKGFGTRCDGSSVDVVDGNAVDSLRGKPGTFLPVVDVRVHRCNYSEQQAYRNFTTKYRQQWRLMDPVFASLDVLPESQGREKLHLSVHITPYAQSEYRFLTQYLGSATTKYLSGGSDELMGISASLKDGGTAYSAHLGVKDTQLDFTIEQGQLKVDGRVEPNAFVHDRSFAAVTPTGTRGLMTLNGLRTSLQKREPIPLARSRPAPQRRAVQTASNPFSMITSIFDPQGMVIRAGATAFGEAFKAAAAADVTMNSKWAIYSTNLKLRRQIDKELSFMEAPLPAEIHANVSDVSDSAIAPYLSAHSFCDARYQSAKVAGWLDFWSFGLNADAQDFLASVEHVCRGSLVCPLGGEFIRTSEEESRWTSTKWESPSLSQVSQVPDDYKFEFIDWFKGLNLRFSLNARSLESDIEVIYHPSKPTDFSQSNSSVANQISADNAPANFEMTSNESKQEGLASRRVGQKISSGFASSPQPRSEPEQAQRVEPNLEERTPNSQPRGGTPVPVESQNARLPTVTNSVETPRSKPQPVKPAWIGIRINPTRMQVSLVKPNQPASRTDLRVGDRIVQVNNIRVSNLDELRQAIGRAGELNGIVDLQVERNGQTHRIQVQLDSPDDVDL